MSEDERVARLEVEMTNMDKRLTAIEGRQERVVWAVVAAAVAMLWEPVQKVLGQ